MRIPPYRPLAPACLVQAIALLNALPPAGDSVTSISSAATLFVHIIPASTIFFSVGDKQVRALIAAYVYATVH